MNKLNRKQIDNEQQIFVSLAEQSTEFIGICDMNFMPFFVNEAGQKIVGLDSLEQALDTPVKEFFFPEDQKFIYEEFFPRVLREGRAEVEIRFRHFKTGQPLWMIYNVFHVLDSEGNPIGLATVSRNITERKEMEEKLRDSQSDLHRAQAVGHIGSWRFNARKNKLVWSAENHYIFGIPEGTSLTYETFLSVIHPDDRKYVDQMWKACLRGKPFDIEHRLIIGGEIKWVKENAELEFDEKGVLLGAFGTTQDITSRKHAEEALHEADRRKNEFLATLAHELRNPLMPIRNAAAILKLYNSSDSTFQEALDLIDRQLQHMVRLIDDLMDVSRIARGKLLLHRERVDLMTIIEHTLEAAQPHIEQAGHVLNLSLPRQVIHLNADPVRLTQVFLNLLCNACKYTNEGGTIRLIVKQEGANVVVNVTDTGIGIPSEYLHKLFELFTQVPSNSEQTETGLGIGLSLARALVELHEGSIEAKSDGLGKGSNFVVRLPIFNKTQAPKMTEPQEEDKPQSKALRILVADDNRDVAKSLDMLLKIGGHEVVTVHDGLQAIEVAAHYRPDVVILDIGMPKLGGHDVCRNIREQPWGKDIRIYALTGLGRTCDLSKSRESGFSDHLVKPVDPTMLLRLLADQEGCK